MWGQDSVTASVFRISQVTEGVVSPGSALAAAEQIQMVQPGWFFFLIFALSGFLAWIISYYGPAVMQTAQASTNYNITFRMFGDNSVLQKQMDQVLYLFYFLNMAFLLLLFEERYHLHPYTLEGITLFIFNFLLLVGIFFARIVLLNVAGFLFGRINLFREYLYHIFLYNKIAGICILPLLALMAYTGGWIREFFYWFALVLILLIVLLRVARSIIFSFRKDVSIFYMFLYLCALETVPLILLYRWLEGTL